MQEAHYQRQRWQPPAAPSGGGQFSRHQARTPLGVRGWDRNRSNGPSGGGSSAGASTTSTTRVGINRAIQDNSRAQVLQWQPDQQLAHQPKSVAHLISSDTDDEEEPSDTTRSPPSTRWPPPAQRGGEARRKRSSPRYYLPTTHVRRTSQASSDSGGWPAAVVGQEPTCLLR
jgi:hypothetical protein